MTLRQSQTQKKAPRFASHCSDIAGGPSQTFPPNRIRRVNISQEVTPFQKPIARQDRFESAPRSPNRRVIPNSLPYPVACGARARFSCRPLDFSKQNIFTAFSDMLFASICSLISHAASISRFSCPIGQWTGIHSLSQIHPIRGLTPSPTKFNMVEVANRNSRFR